MSDTATTSDQAGPPAQDQAQTFIEKAKAILSDLLEVKVVTAVGNVDINIITEGDSTKTVLKTTEALQESIVTIVKITDGDVSTIISDGLLANADIRAFHAEQVTKSLTVLPDNLRALVAIAKSLLDIGDGE